MSAWDNEALAKIAAAEEVRIASVRPDGTLRRETVPYDEELRVAGAGAIAAVA